MDRARLACLGKNGQHLPGAPGWPRAVGESGPGTIQQHRVKGRRPSGALEVERGPPPPEAGNLEAGSAPLEAGGFEAGMGNDKEASIEGSVISGKGRGL